MAKRGAEAWAAIVAEAETSGIPHPDVAKKHGVSLPALKYHVYKARAVKKAEPRILPVRAGSDAAVAAEFGSIRVSFREGCDPAYVAAVLSALAKC
jgi:hypothetical protein